MAWVGGCVVLCVVLSFVWVSFFFFSSFFSSVYFFKFWLCLLHHISSLSLSHSFSLLSLLSLFAFFISIIQEESVVKIREGWLKKKSPKGLPGMHVWQKRYLRLFSDVLQYFKKETQSTPQGLIPLQFVSSVTQNLNSKQGKVFDILVNYLDGNGQAQETRKFTLQVRISFFLLFPFSFIFLSFSFSLLISFIFFLFSFSFLSPSFLLSFFSLSSISCFLYYHLFSVSLLFSLSFLLSAL